MGIMMTGALRVSVAMIILASTAIVAQVPAPPAGSTIDLGGKLYRAVFLSGPGTLSTGDLAAIPEPSRGRLSTFLSRRSSFSSAYESKPEDADAVARDAKRRLIERAIVALIDVPDINARALEFVKAAPIAHEWEGKVQGPLAEAAHAEDVLKKAPNGPLAPFLYIFIAQRQRAAFEAAERAKDEPAMKAAAKKYRAFMDRARSASDPIFRLLADDLDRVPFVYTRSQKHPRDYNPDA
jgi:hypothetical protein